MYITPDGGRAGGGGRLYLEKFQGVYTQFTDLMCGL